MKIMSNTPMLPVLFAMLAMPAWSGVSAQQQDYAVGQEDPVTVTGSPPADLAGLPEGPKVEGFISARRAEKMQVRGADGANTPVLLSDATQIRASGGFLGISRSTLAQDSLLNGLPVTVETVEWNGALVASRVVLKNKDLKIASMIHNGTEQGFAEQSAATEALRGRVADIDQYNIKGTTNVYFDTGRWTLTAEAEQSLCAAATQAGQTNNALILVIGYTDATGSEDYNQVLSERRASRVVNYLQQRCGWAPYRMLTPTGMAEADPAADNMTPEGMAQNRRVAVNILVSKAVDGM